MSKLDPADWAEKWCTENMRRLDGMTTTEEAVKIYKPRMLAAAKAEGYTQEALELELGPLDAYLETKYESVTNEPVRPLRSGFE